MDFSLKISHLTSLSAASNGQQLGEKFIQYSFGKAELPALPQLKPMQRRRLSPFAKIALHCAYESSQQTNAAFDIIFSSRHGDLDKTSALLNDLAEKEPLSPTAFSLSVHNAVPGLFSIFTQNTAPSSAISAGKESFLMALVDAYARLNSYNCDQVLLIHADQALPEFYVEYADESQVDHAFACIVTRVEKAPKAIEKQTPNTEIIRFSTTAHSATQDNVANSTPLALNFVTWFNSSQSHCNLSSSDKLWRLSRVEQ
ncbi:hypothetical protein GCM10009111_19190 [Colwellia asteriadis]|uniref:Beta-ketoacyl synthase-like N-terminal domain-containing protein n=1 Tax=Colwellia asteriadis TaxID=517723 RepID=A0ABN1L766_9GAMM